MSEQVPSKELTLIEHLIYCVNGCEFNGMPNTADSCRKAIAEIEHLREDCRRWENARNVWMADEKRLKEQVARLKQYICVTALAGYRCAPCAERLAPKPAHEPAADLLEASQRVSAIALGAAGKHAERVVELEAEVSTLREHLSEVNRLLSLNVAEVQRLRAAQPPGGVYGS